MSSEINPETGEVVVGRSPRFSLWVAFLVFSTVTLGSSVEVKNDLEEVTSDAKWAVACSSITFALTTVMVMLQLHPLYAIMVTNNKLEGVICIILVAFWSGIVSIVSDAENNLAVRSSNNNECNNTVLNGNLYYFSWAAFVASICLLVSYLRSVFGLDLVGEVQNRSQRMELWGGLLACSLVVMGASANIFQIDCKPVEPGLEIYCRRCTFGISIGTIGAFFAIVVVGMKLITRTASFFFEGMVALILTILNACGVAFITSAKGPGSSIGNLYYFTWFSFLVSLAIASSCYSDMTSVNLQQTGPGDDAEKADSGDIQIEQLPPDQEQF
ncbi:expressed unknown protein [Seminavis robusta]|uniref:Uncharacterized protein n=1 Tax=Seminavis robusta TaxID=568900 RepID=A0A9N8EK06_9STRA|nr:expressed unknown protein [Seminavis robusta]|eukprot:Sro1056_g236130.1 n/a (328) ;mRNA; f:2803-4220